MVGIVIFIQSTTFQHNAKHNNEVVSSRLLQKKCARLCLWAHVCSLLDTYMCSIGSLSSFNLYLCMFSKKVTER